MNEKRVYIYDNTEMARSIILTLEHFGLHGRRVGSAVIMTQSDFNVITTKTLWPHPEMVLFHKIVPTYY